MANPYVNKVIVDGVSRLDLTGDTVTAAALLAGKTAHDASGTAIEGTMTERGTYSNTISSKAQSCSIPAGHYTGGSVSISSAEQAKIIAGNIKHGITILGVQGTYSGDPVTEKKLYTEGVKNVAWSYGTNITDGSNYIQISKNVSGYPGAICTTAAVNLKGYTSLNIDYNGPEGLNGSPTFGINSVCDTSRADPDTAYKTLTASTARKVLSLDITNYTGSYYVKIFHAKNQVGLTYLRIFRVWVE